jgi:hypothetical protein
LGEYPAKEDGRPVRFELTESTRQAHTCVLSEHKPVRRGRAMIDLLRVGAEA